MKKHERRMKKLAGRLIDGLWVKRLKYLPKKERVEEILRRVSMVRDRVGPVSSSF